MSFRIQSANPCTDCTSYSLLPPSCCIRSPCTRRRSWRISPCTPCLSAQRSQHRLLNNIHHMHILSGLTVVVLSNTLKTTFYFHYEFYNAPILNSMIHINIKTKRRCQLTASLCLLVNLNLKKACCTSELIYKSRF